MNARAYHEIENKSSRSWVHDDINRKKNELEKFNHLVFVFF